MTYLPFLSDYYLSASYNYSAQTANNTTNPLYVDRPGKWFFYLSMLGTAVGSTDQGRIDCGAFFNSAVRQETQVIIGNAGRNWSWAYGSYEQFASGQYWQGRTIATQLSGGSFTMNIYLFFIPTTDNRGY